jgi:hypothetical protein
MRPIFLTSLALLGLVACSSSGPAPAAPDAGAADPTSSVSFGGGTGSSSSKASASGLPNETSAPYDASAAEAGILTAGMWDDNLNYSFFTTYLASHKTLAGSPGFDPSDFDGAHTASANRGVKSVVDAALVLDTTGSMGDEISYLTAEFSSISGSIAAAYPGADQRWALVVYRDRPDSDPGDDYVVKHYDFTGDMHAFAATVAAQSANGGGDYPESPDLGLAELQKLSWRTDDSVAKVAFWVADAPDHVDEADALKQAIVDTKDLGVHVYPVAASGTDALLELSMRSAAAITGGRYGFLTDDSGVGDAHKVPEIPCFYVTRLEKGLVRAIGMELTGAYIPPTPSTIIRAAGDPSTDGTCALAGGQTVEIF